MGDYIFSKKYEDLFNSAIAARNAGHLQDACERLSQFILEYPEFGMAYVIKGGILKDMGRLGDAIICFHKGVEFLPKTALASRCLFCALWEADAIDLAFDEMRRFLSVGGEPSVYQGILDEMKAQRQACQKEDGRSCGASDRDESVQEGRQDVASDASEQGVDNNAE